MFIYFLSASTDLKCFSAIFVINIAEATKAVWHQLIEFTALLNFIVVGVPLTVWFYSTSSASSTAFSSSKPDLAAAINVTV